MIFQVRRCKNISPRVIVSLPVIMIDLRWFTPSLHLEDNTVYLVKTSFDFHYEITTASRRGFSANQESFILWWILPEQTLAVVPEQIQQKFSTWKRSSLHSFTIPSQVRVAHSAPCTAGWLTYFTPHTRHTTSPPARGMSMSLSASASSRSQLPNES